jgi:hypothetical protein
MSIFQHNYYHKRVTKNKETHRNFYRIFQEIMGIAGVHTAALGGANNKTVVEKKNKKTWAWSGLGSMDSG